MNKTLIAILHGAATASAWWAAALWPTFEKGVLFGPAIVLSVALVLWVIYETICSWDA